MTFIQALSAFCCFVFFLNLCNCIRLLQPHQAGKIYIQKVVNYRSLLGLNGPERYSGAQWGHSWGPLHKRVPKLTWTVWDKEKKSRWVLFSSPSILKHATSLADPSTLPISVKYGKCACRITQASFTGKGEDTTSSVGDKSPDSYWK